MSEKIISRVQALKLCSFSGAKEVNVTKPAKDGNQYVKVELYDRDIRYYKATPKDVIRVEKWAQYYGTVDLPEHLLAAFTKTGCCISK